MLGKAAVAMWWDIPADVRAEWEAWHSGEHMHERLGIPGFRRGTRWVGMADAGTYFVLYEAAELATLTGGTYMERLNNPTPLSKQMMPHHKNMVRSLCVVRETRGDGVPYAMATIRFSASEKMPALPSGRGITLASLLQAQPLPDAQTTEQKIRGRDKAIDCALLIGGYDAAAVGKTAKASAPAGAIVGLYRLGFSLAS